MEEKGFTITIPSKEEGKVERIFVTAEDLRKVAKRIETVDLKSSEETMMVFGGSVWHQCSDPNPVN